VWLAPRFEWPDLRPLISDLQRALRHRSAHSPQKKALPFTDLTFRALTITLPFWPKAMAYLAFRTASRLGDISSLLASSFSLASNGDVVLSWYETKTNKDATPRPDHVVRIMNPAPILVEAVTEIMRLKPDTRPFGDRCKRTLRTALRKMPVSLLDIQHFQRMDPKNIIRTRYSGHSFKRGAALKGAQGLLDPLALMLLLKQK
jgi:hypothetical protein